MTATDDRRTARQQAIRRALAAAGPDGLTVREMMAVITANGDYHLFPPRSFRSTVDAELYGIVDHRLGFTDERDIVKTWPHVSARPRAHKAFVCRLKEHGR